ncbi:MULTISPECIES: diguanylate cyclase [unclassified Motilimonas]|uniref:GGDEF domain-containing protein n=1 Tax=unclassified Motilimonas TaxID=2643697 RepID=UPI001E5E5F93|nr:MULTISPECIES: diguanylate cyclase [unclassified Motilimonas]MCE0556561.1 GGDEF domain-containing protein [Motilimonas sp. E26]MDO6524872.1 diguanylate cyclase [Motilimonas sp. 1_MG-2023]
MAKTADLLRVSYLAKDARTYFMFQTLVQNMPRAKGFEAFCYSGLGSLSSLYQGCTLLLVDDQSLYVVARANHREGVRYFSTPLSVYQEPDFPLISCYSVINEGKSVDGILPLVNQQGIIGLLIVEGKKGVSSKVNEYLLEALSFGLDNYRLSLVHQAQQSELQRKELALARADEQTAAFSGLLKELHEITIELSKLYSLDELYRHTVEAGTTRLGIDRMAVFIMDTERDMYFGTYGTNEQGEVVDESYFQNNIPNVPFVQEALTRKDYLSVWDDAPILHDTKEIGSGWNAMIALWHGDETIGWIACDNFINHKPLPDYQKEVLILLASTVAQMIMRKQAEEQVMLLNRELELRVRERTTELAQAYRALADANSALQLVSAIDSLTGLANRRAFDERLESEWINALREHSNISLVLIDVDFFKQYNDRFGHPEGDVCLQRISQALKECVNSNKDLVARYGGEEIVLLCPGISAEQTAVLAELCRKKIELLNISHPENGIKERVTISLGHVCIQPVNGMPHKNLICIADQALYHAKQTGRNISVQAEYGQFK